MPESINTFEGGMNSDLSPIFQKPNTYVEAINVEILNDELQGSVAISNAKGNKFQQSIPDVGDIFKLNIIGVGTTDITINGITSATPFTITVSTTYFDLYNFIINDTNFDLSLFNVYYNDTKVVIVPIPSNSLTLLISNPAILSGDTSPYIPAQTNLQPIGYGIINDDIYIFTTNCTDKDPQNNGGGYGQIWKLTYDNITFDPNFSTITLIYSADLSFTTYYHIPQTAVVPRYENSGIKRLYWTDFYNKIRNLNVANPQAFALDPSILELIPSVDFDIPILQDIRNGGTAIPVGVYQIAYRLKNNGGAVTNFSNLSDMIFVCPTDESTQTNGNGFSNYIGGSIGSTATKIITWEVSNIDLDFERIEIALLHRDILDNPPTISIIYDDSLGDDDNYTVVYDGTQTSIDLTYSEFLVLSSTITHAKTLSTKDNRLILGNIRATNSGAGDINFDTRAYRSSTPNSEDIYLTNNSNQALYDLATLGDITLNPETNDNINDYTSVNAGVYKPNTAILGGEGPNISYEFYTVDIAADRNAGPTPFEVIDNAAAPWRLTNPRFELVSGTDLNNGISSITNQNALEVQDHPTRFPNPINDGFKYPPINSFYRGYQRNEIYRFGIQFYDKSKNPYFVKWIGDIKFPDFNDVNNNAFNEDGTGSISGLGFCPSHVYNKVGYLEAFVRTLGIQFTINNIDDIKDLISGYSIVRVKREKGDRTIVSEGYTTRSNFADYGGMDNQIYTTSPFTSSDGNIPNGSTDGAKGFFITPDFCEGGYIIPSSSMTLNVKGLLLPSNSDASMSIGGTDPYYYYKLYDWNINGDNPNPIAISNINTLNYGGQINVGTYAINNYDFDSANTNDTLSQSIGSKCYYYELSSAINYNNISNGKFLVTIERTLLTQYGGNTYSARADNNYIACSHFQPVRELSPNTYTFQVFGGDIFINMYDSCRWAKNWGVTGRGISGEGKFSTTFFLPIESAVNTDLRNGTYMNKDFNTSFDTGIQMEETYNYNDVYSSEDTVVTYFPKPDPFILNNEYDNRFYTSEIKINGELTDSWTIIKENNYWDVEGIYGPINSSLIMNDKLYFWQNRAFGIMQVNPRSLVQDINGTSLQVGTGLPLQRHDYVSTTVGTKHQSSTISSDKKIYFYDTNTKKIYTFNSEEGLTPFSDVKGMYAYLSNNLGGQIQNIDKPLYTDNLLGTNGVAATYDYKRHKAVFTFHSAVQDRASFIQTSFTLGINEMNDTFLGFYSFKPKMYINDYKHIFSTDNVTSLTSLKDIYIHDEGNYSEYYGTIYNSYIKFIVNQHPQYTKVFDNLVYDSQSKNDSNVNINNDTWNTIRITNDHQNTDVIPLIYDVNIKRKERSWQLAIPRNRVLYTSSNSPDIYTDLSTTNKPFADRIRDKYISVELTYNNINNYQLLTNNVKTIFRQSIR